MFENEKQTHIFDDIMRAEAEPKVIPVMRRTKKDLCKDVMIILTQNAPIIGRVFLEMKSLIQNQKQNDGKRSVIIATYTIVGIFACVVSLIFFRPFLPAEVSHVLSAIAGMLATSLRDSCKAVATSAKTCEEKEETGEAVK